MAPDADANVNVAEIIDGLTAVITSPFVLLLSAGVKQPFVQAAIKEGVAFSERLKETGEDTRERLEDLAAEAKQQFADHRDQSTRSWVRSGESEVAIDLNRLIETLNEEVGRATEGLVDLRVLIPLGLGALALRNLLIKGLQIDDIPWFILAWYAFDSFTQLNSGQEPLPIYPVSQPNGAESNGAALAKQVVDGY